MNQERPHAKGEPKDLDRDLPAGSTGSGAASATSGVAGASAAGTTADDAYWRDNYQSRPYIDATYGYEDYGPAYRYGAESYAKHGARAFDEVESDLGAGWERAKAGSRLTWERAKAAVRDAWDRIAHHGEHRASGGPDRYMG